MNKKLAFGSGALVLIIIVIAGCLYLFVANSKTKTTSDASATQPDGVFSETYVPHGWTVVGNPSTAATVMAFASPDYLLKWENPATDCKDAGCTQQVLVKGANFALAYRPCGRGETEAVFRQREQRNITTLKGLVDQTPISIQGHEAVLVHTRNLTNTTSPVMDDAYSLTLFSAPSRGYCQDVNFIFVASTTTDYGTEFQKFINGLQFTPDKSSQQ
ncbi:MAG TPA: hypothetical protein VMV38_00245 [Candidatus Paceibacterota bacterium]|nr:hypothetical protein [Candidatus Paceibacterota bacterium]